MTNGYELVLRNTNDEIIEKAFHEALDDRAYAHAANNFVMMTKNRLVHFASLVKWEDGESKTIMVCNDNGL